MTRSTAAARGFLTLTAHSFNPTDPILILQHPNAAPLKLSFGAVERPDPPNRVLYEVNTEGGSSGSPCLTQNLKVTAIHHFGLTENNRGVTHEAILAFLQTKQDIRWRKDWGNSSPEERLLLNEESYQARLTGTQRRQLIETVLAAFNEDYLGHMLSFDLARLSQERIKR